MLGIGIFVLTLVAIMMRPFRITEALAAIGGAALMLLFGFVAPTEAVHLVLSEWNIYGFFLGLMIITAMVDQAGMFEALAGWTARLAKGSASTLFIGVFIVGTILTAFLSNDATALILTPAVYAMVTRLRLPVLPFMFVCTFIADTASFLLPVSNPINVIILNSFGAGLGPFLHYLLLPALFSIAFNILVFLAVFRKDLRLTYDPEILPVWRPASLVHFRFTAVALCVVALAFILASIFTIPLSIVALSGAALLLIGSLCSRRLDWKRLRGEIAWSLFIFISGIFLVIRGVENLGLAGRFSAILANLANASTFWATIFTAAASAVGANLINNLPMALLMVPTLHGVMSTANAQPALVYAAVMGCDLGPNLTTFGSLATMFWLLILRRKGLEVSSIEYFKLGTLVVPVMVVVGAILIWLI